MKIPLRHIVTAAFCCLILVGCSHDYGKIKVKDGTLYGYTKSGKKVAVSISSVNKANSDTTFFTARPIVKVRLSDGRTIYGGSYEDQGDAMVAAFDISTAKFGYKIRVWQKNHARVCEVYALPWSRDGKVTLHQLHDDIYVLEIPVKKEQSGVYCTASSMVTVTY